MCTDKATASRRSRDVLAGGSCPIRAISDEQKVRAWERYRELEKRSFGRAYERLVLDGATGSELTELPGVDWEDQWSGWPAHLAAPGAVQAVHASYVEAGIDVVTTNTYCTNRHVMGDLCERFNQDDAGGHGQSRDIVEEANRVAVEIARLAAASTSGSAGSRRVLVAGSMSNHAPNYTAAATAAAASELFVGGCSEERCSCHGSNPTAIGGWPAEEAELRNYREQASHLAHAGVDFLLLEMVKDRRHGDLLVKAASEVGIPVVIGLTLRLSETETGAEATCRLTARDDEHLHLGAMIDRWKDLPNVVGFGAMHCSATDAKVMVAAIRERWGGLVVCYPNRQRGSHGLVTSDSDSVYDNIDPMEYAKLAGDWYAAGANLVGGCCGVGPAHIRAVAELAKSPRPADATTPEGLVAPSQIPTGCGQTPQQQVRSNHGLHCVPTVPCT